MRTMRLKGKILNSPNGAAAILAAEVWDAASMILWKNNLQWGHRQNT
jgi:hypothetical protein